MCLGEGVSKLTLIVLNIVFFLLGLALIAMGAVILTDNTDKVFEFMGRIPLTSEVIEEGLYSTSWLFNFAYMMLIAGGFFFLVGGAGLFGACCKQKCLLVVYGTVLFLIIVLELGVVALAILYGNQVVSYLQSFLQDSLQDYYTGLSYDDGTITLADEAHGVSTAWDFVQVQFECCGVINGSDYETVSKWPAYYTVSGVNISATVPVTCCAMSDKGSWPSDPSTITFTNITECIGSAAEYATNTQGCYDSIYNKLKSYSMYCAIVAAVVGVVELSGLWASISLYRAINRNQVDPYHNKA